LVESSPAGSVTMPTTVNLVAAALELPMSMVLPTLSFSVVA